MTPPQHLITTNEDAPSGAAWIVAGGGRGIDETEADDRSRSRDRRGAIDREFTEFVTSAYPRVLHMADLLMGDRGRAEDLVQTVLMRAYLRWPRIRQNNPVGYVRTALVNTRT